MEVTHGLTGENLDLIIHSPGGSAEVTEIIVKYLRSKFKKIRVIVPQGAMSAATMLACSADEIIMGAHSYLGPIDSQIILHTPLGIRSVPAQSILDQFDMATKECKADPKNLGVWMPILGQYGPSLLIQCKNALDLSKDLVTQYLSEYMFKDEDNGVDKAKDIANKLADHRIFKSHNRHISRKQVKDFGLKITNLEEDKDFEDLVMSVFHATTHTFNGTMAAKIIENHDGKAFIKFESTILMKPVPKEEAKKVKRDKENTNEKIKD
ncbi:hypothetical protein ES704_03594 [subsurface metagenome]|jgi:hypothetical protein